MSFDCADFQSEVFGLLQKTGAIPKGADPQDPAATFTLVQGAIHRLLRAAPPPGKAAQRGRPVFAVDIERIKRALTSLKLARGYLRAAGANNAADYVARSIKSSEGALNNARAHFDRSQR